MTLSDLISSLRRAGVFLGQPIVWLFEALGMLPPTLVATHEVEVVWPARVTNEGEEEEREETITFFLFQHTSGRRFYRTHTYGKSLRWDADDQYVAAILVWVYGGPLPIGAQLTRTVAEVIPLREVK